MPDLTIGDVLERSDGSVKTGPFGTKLSASEYSDVGVPVISVGEVGHGSIAVSGRTKRVGLAVTQRMPEYLLAAGDIVFARKGAVDRSAWIRPHEAGFFLGSDGIRLRFGPSVDSRFMAYQLQSSRVKKWLLQHAVGTTLASLNEPTLKSVPVDLPPIREQRGIAATLSALDDKIQSNQRSMALLDELYRILWAHTHDGATETRRLADLVSTQYGLTASAEHGGRGPKFLRVTDINKENWLSWRSVPSVTVGALDFEKYGLRFGDLVVARMADPGKSALYDDASIPSVFASYLVRLKTRNYAEALYIYGYLK